MKTLIITFLSLMMLTTSCKRDHVIPNGVWEKRGSVISPNLPQDNLSVAEPNVLQDSDPQILTGNASVFKMWFRCGWTPHIDYAESVDGINWSRRIIPIIKSHFCPSIHKVNDTYFLYAVDSTWLHMDCFISSNGVDFTLQKSNILGTNFQAFGNTASTVQNGIYYLYFEAMTNNVWKIFYATSSDGITWSSNEQPIIQWAGSYGGPEFHKIGSYYYLWVHGSVTGTLPTDIYRFKSSDMVHWEKEMQSPVLYRSTVDEGVEQSVGQVADPSMIEVSGKVYMFYDAGPNGLHALTNAVDFQIKLAVADMTFEQLVQTQEGLKK